MTKVRLCFHDRCFDGTASAALFCRFYRERFDQNAKFGFDTKPLADLIHWGDIIDGAQYPTPQSAVELAEPATQLALVIEAAPENGLPAKIIPELAYRPLTEMVKLPLVAKHLGPLLERHRKSIEILHERIEASNGVIFFDVSDMDLEGYNKFIPYLLHPECVYSV